MKQALDEALDVYRDFFECALIGLLSLDEFGMILEVNAAMCGLLGQDPHFLVGKPFLSRLVPEDRRAFLDHLRLARAGEESPRDELRLQHRSGGVTPVQMLLRRSRLDRRVIFRVAVVDLRERYRLERERLGAEMERERFRREEELARRASEAKDRFLAVLSHELRTPLTPVMFALARLASLPGLPDDAARLIKVITRNLDLERQLIDDLLDMNRIANGKLVVRREPLDVHDIVRDAMSIIDREFENRHVRVQVTLEARESSVRGDANRLRQVFWNLLANAVKFTDEGGHVRVTSSNPANGSLLLTISDTGVGIEADRIPLLFEPFEQANRGDAAIGGLGLGLSICKGVIEAHEGSIHARSAGAGQGTTFEVQLPVIRIPAAV